MNFQSAEGYSYDDDEDYVPTKKVKYSSHDDDGATIKKKKHTLDSDEEDDDTGCAGDDDLNDAANKSEDEIEGQYSIIFNYFGLFVIFYSKFFS